ncbi:hypothetical protein KIM67_02000 [Flagellimonas sp. 389]|uniref:DUF5694 domain-containing protein n=1 Tax=Flagellimonas sp. 389 TaxID=2835862 RepID=UPI001BD1C8A4|nr:DUF5694 domain-containing protein [Flagellimonas sp. 389]MBS9461167.1 hypothetical protein [Flagellimonas sp. 389]
MKKVRPRFLFTMLSFLFSQSFLLGQAADMVNGSTEIILLGTLHFNQFQNPTSPSTDFSGALRQQEFKDVVDSLSRFGPDAIFIEREPKQQSKIDSLFKLDALNHSILSDGLSEVYQIGFKLAKKNKLPTVYGIDHYESVSQNLFENGENLEVFADSLKAFQNIGRAITKKFLQGKTTIGQFLSELNTPENIKMSYRLFFNTPAYVTNGNFKNEEEFEGIDTNFIGAEYISLFYKRNLKMYSNILKVQRKTNAKRVIVILGQVHVGVIQQMLEENPKFNVVSPNRFLE